MFSPHSWLRSLARRWNLIAGNRKSRKLRKRQPSRRAAPPLRLEELEPYFLLSATLTWQGGNNDFSSSNWTDGTNSNLAPVAGDNYVIDSGTVTVSNSQSMANLTVSGASSRLVVSSSGSMTASGTASISGGADFTQQGSVTVAALSLDSSSTMENVGASLTINGASTLSGAYTQSVNTSSLTANASVTLAGNSILDAGSIDASSEATNVTNTGTLTLGGTVSLYGGISNQGTINQTGGSLDLIYNNTVLLTNTSTGTYDIQETNSGSSVFSGSGIFQNQGLLENTAGGVVVADNVANQGGTLQAGSGDTLKLSNATYQNGGTFSVSGGGVIDLTDGSTTGTITGTSTVVSSDGTGTVQLSSGDLNVGTGGANLISTTSGVLQWTGGTLMTEVSPTPTLTIDSGSYLTLAGNDTLETNLDNQGEIDQTAGQLSISSGSTFTNDTTGVYNITEAGNVVAGGGTFANLGSLSAGSIMGSITSSITSKETIEGTVNVLDGATLDLANANYNGGGTFEVASGAILDLTDDTNTGSISGTWTASGGGTILVGDGSGSQLAVGAAGATLIDPIISCVFEWTGGILGSSSSGTLTVGSGTALDIDAPSETVYLYSDLDNEGTINEEAGELQMTSSVTLTNQGTFNIQETGTVTQYGTFLNTGTLNYSASGTATVNNDLLDEGAIAASAGTLELDGATYQIGGSFQVSGGAIVDLTDGGSSTISGSWTVTTGTGGGTVQLASGTLNVDAGGAALDATNQGVLVWSGGTLAGSSSSSTLTIDSGCYLTVDGSDTLNGANLNNLGEVDQTAGQLTVDSGSSFTNQGIYDITASGNVLKGAGSFNNTATLIANSSCSITPTTNNIGGTVDAAAALQTLSLANARFLATGTFNVRNGNIDLTDGTTSTLSGTWNVVASNSGGTLLLDGGTLAVAGGGATLATSAGGDGVLDWSGGQLGNSGSGTLTLGPNFTFNVSAAVSLNTELVNEGTLNLSAPVGNSVTLYSPLVNDGTINQISGGFSLYYLNTTLLTNASGATFSIGGSSSSDSIISGNGTFLNQGLLENVSGVEREVKNVVNDGGTIQSNSSSDRLDLYNVSYENGDTLNVSNGGLIYLTDNSTSGTISGTTTIVSTTSNTGSVYFDAGDLAVGTGGATLISTVTNALNFNGGTLTGSSTPQTLTLAEGSQMLLGNLTLNGANLDNQGTINQDGGVLTVDGGSTFTNDVASDSTAGQYIIGFGGNFLSGGGAFIDKGNLVVNYNCSITTSTDDIEGTITNLSAGLVLGLANANFSGGGTFDLGDGVIDLTNGNTTSTISGAWTVVITGSSAHLQLSGGTLDVGAGGAQLESTTNGALTWSGGTLGSSSSGTLSLGPGFSLNITNSVDLNGSALDNYGVITQTGGTLSLSGATLTNAVDGYYFIDTTGTAVQYGSLINQGELKGDVSSGTITVSNDLLEEGGVVQSFGGGTLALSGATFQGSGYFEVAQGSIIDLTGGGSSTMSGTWTATAGAGGGTVQVGSGDILEIGSAGATFDASQGVLTFSGGDISDASGSTGSLSIAAGSYLTLAGNVSLSTPLNLINDGTIDQTAGLLNMATNATLTNASSGTFDIEETTGGQTNSNGTILNEGVLEDTRTAAVTAQYFTTSGGGILATAGTLHLYGNTFDNGTTISVSGGATIDLTDGGQTNLSGTSTVTVGTGGGTVLVGNGDLNLGVGGATLVSTTAGVLQWTGGTLEGENGPGGTKTLTLTQGSFLTLGGNVILRGELDNQGTINQTAGQVQAYYTLTNDTTGTYNITASGNVFYAAGGGSFINKGLLTSNTAVSSTASITSTSTDEGSVDVLGGELALANTTYTGGGTFDVSAGATLDLTDGTNSGSITGTWIASGGGTVIVSDTSGQLGVGSAGATLVAASVNPAVLEWTGGILGTSGGSGILTLGANTVLDVKASVSLYSALLNQGTINQLAGTLSMNGSTLTNQGTFDIQETGTVTATQYGTFLNQGTLENTTSDTATLSADLLDEGAVDASAGTLELYIATYQIGGSFEVSGGAVVDLTGGNASTMSGTWTATASTGGGSVQLASGVLEIGAAGATLDGAPGVLKFSGGTIEEASGSTASLTIGAGYYLTLAGSVAFGSINLVNDGTIDQTAGLLNMATNATLTNASGGTFDIEESTGGQTNSNGTLLNEGTLEDTQTSAVTAKYFTTSGGGIMATAGTLHLYGNTFDDGTTLTASGGASIDLTDGFQSNISGTVTVDSPGGTVLMANGDLNLEPGGATLVSPNFGYLQWDGGTIEGENGSGGVKTLTLAQGSSMTASGNGILRANLDNQGYFDQSGTTQSYYTFTNDTTGTYSVETDGTVFTSGTFINKGYLSDDSSDARIDPTTGIDEGTVDVEGGTLSLANTTYTGGGTFDVFAGSSLDLTDGTAATMTGTWIASGVGTVIVSNTGQLKIGAAGATLQADAINPGVFEWTGGILGTSGGSGILTLAANTVLDVNASGGASLYSALLNQGTINEQAGTVSMNGSVTLTNQGTFNIQETGTVTATQYGIFLNQGTLENTSSDTATMSADLLDEGTITVSAGQLNLYDDTFQGGGSFLVSGGGIVNLNGGANAYMTGTWTVTAGIGGGSVQLSSGSLNIGVTGATFDAAPDVLNFTGGDLQYVSGSTAALTIAAGSYLNLGGTFTLYSALLNQGTIIQTAGYVYFTGGTLTNAGTYDIQESGTVTSGGTGTFVNQGILNSAAGIGGTASITSKLSNPGSVNVLSGSLTANPDTMDISGSTLTQGSWAVSAGASLTLNNNVSLTTIGAGASISLEGSGAAFTNLTNNLTTNDGSLTVTGDAAFSLPTGFTNSGTLTAGPGSIITDPGSFTQTSSGILSFLIGGPPLPNSDLYGQLAVTGSAALNGTLNATLVNGYFPEFGQDYTVMTFGSSTGAFTNYTGALAGLPSVNPVFTPESTPTTLALDTAVSVVPSIQGIANLTAGIPAAYTSTLGDTQTGQTYTYAWNVTGVSGAAAGFVLPSSVVTDESTLVFTPPQPGTYQVSLTVTDSLGVSGTASFLATAGDPAPVVLISGTPSSGSIGSAVSLSSSVLESTGATPTSYSWSVALNGQPYTLPSGTVTNTSTFSFTPTQGGLYTVSLTVGDSLGGTGSQSVSLLIGSGPTASIFGIPSSVPLGMPLTLTSASNNPDLSGPLTYTLGVTGPNNFNYTQVNSSGVFTFTPTGVGTYQAALTVRDANGDTAAATPVTFNVVGVPVPVAITGAPPRGSVTNDGTTVSLGSNVSEPAGVSPATYTWSVTLNGNPYTLPSDTVTNASTLSFKPSAAGMYTVNLNVTDSAGDQGTTSAVFVTQSAQSLTLSQTSAFTVNSSTGQMKAVVNNPASNVSYTYAWTVSGLSTYFTASGPGTTSSNTTSLFSFVAPAPGSYTVNVTASGSDGTATSASQVVTVAPTYPTPSINGLPSTSISEGQTVSLSSTITEPGGSSHYLYQWTVTAPNGIRYTSINPTLVFTPNLAGTYNVQLTVTDGNNEVGTFSRTFTAIEPPPAIPVILTTAGTGITSSGQTNTLTLNLAAQEPTPGPDVVYTYAWSVIDYNSTSNTTTQVATGSGPTLSFINSSYSSSDNYTVELIVSDAAVSSTAFLPILFAAQGTTLTLTPANVPTGATQVLAVALGNATIDGHHLLASVTQVQTALGGHDTLIGGAGPNILQGDSGNNSLLGGSGPNTLYATGGDTLIGGTGTNSNLFSIMPGAGESITAGAAANTLSFAQATTGVSVNLTQNTGQTQTVSSGSTLSLSGSIQTLVGSTGSDTLTGGNNSTVLGGGGNDTLIASGSNVVLVAGVSQLPAGSNAAGIVQFGGTGNDSLSSSGGSSVLMVGGAGNSTLSNSGGSGVLMIGGGNTYQTISSNGSSVTMMGGSGSSVLINSGGSSITMFGGSGNDSIGSSGGSSVSMVGGAGNSTLSNSGGSGVLMIGGGSTYQTMSSNGSSVTMMGGSGSSVLINSGGSSITMFGGSGNDSIGSSGGSSVSMVGGMGNDSMSSSSGSSVTMVGGSGNDSMSSSGGSSVTMVGGSGNDSMGSSGGSSVYMIGGTGNSTLVSSGGSSITMFGGSGNDSIGSSGGSSVLIVGGSGNDSMSSSGGSSVYMTGGSGNDSMGSSGGSSVYMTGGSGNSTLVSSGGSSITMFGGSGNDSIGSSGGSSVSMVGGMGNDSMSSSSGSSVTMVGGMGNDSMGSSGGSSVYMTGGSGNSTLVSSGGSSITMFGGSGNDSIGSSGGSSVLIVGGSGNDSMSSSGGSSVYMTGGSGNDSMGSSGGSSVYMTGGSGNSTLVSSGGSSITMFGGSGNDSIGSSGGSSVLIVGGSGNDSMSSSGGSSVYMTGGSGNDSMGSSGGSSVYMTGGSGNSTLVSSGGSSITMFGGSGNDSIGSSGGSSVLIVGGSGNDSMSSSSGSSVYMTGGSGNDSMSSSGGSSVYMIGGTGNSTLVSSGGSSITMFGGSGNDSIGSSGGSSVLIVGGSGNDSMSSSGGSSVYMTGGSGNDSMGSSGGSSVYMTGGSGNSTLVSSGGSSITMFGGSGNDSIGSSGGSSVLIVGGSGNDSMSSSGGSSVYMTGGSGNDSLSSSGGSSVTMLGGSGNDSLSSSGGSSVSLIGGSGNSTLVSSGGSSITMFGGSGNDSLASSGNLAAIVVGGSGIDTLTSSADSSAIADNGGSVGDLLSVTGGTSVSLIGGSGNDTLSANGGSAISLYGLDGNNTYETTGTAADPLSVSLNDLATFGQTDPQDDSETNAINTILFPAVSGITLNLSNTSTGTSATAFVTSAIATPQQVATGLNLFLTGQFSNVIGTTGNDWIQGDASNNVLEAGSGNATLIGGTGPATLVAGSGNDSLVAGSSGTTFRFAGTNFGNDTIDPPSDTSNTLDFSKFGGPVTLNLGSATPQTVSAGTSSLALTLQNPNEINAVVDSAYADSITGNSLNDSFYAGSGNDTFTGGGGNDSYFFSGNQLGADTINETTNNNTLNFLGLNAGVSLNLNQSGSQTLNSALTLNLPNPEAFTTVVGTPLDDTIQANNGNDTLIGAGGDDSLVAGSGNDSLQGYINQVVYLDFNEPVPYNGVAYTSDEISAIQQILQQDFADFNYTFVTDPITAAADAAMTGGQYITMEFNTGAAGGASNALDVDHLLLSGVSHINIAPFLGSASLGLVPSTTTNIENLTADITAHELGHLSGLQHQDAFGPIGAGIYSGVNPSSFYPIYTGPTDATETPFDIMASPASVNSTLADAAGINGPTYFGERDDIKLAFADTGTILQQQSLTTENVSVAGTLPSTAALPPGTPSPAPFTITQAYVLPTLPSLAVPNTLPSGVTGSGQTFNVTALAVNATLSTKTEQDFYAFQGTAGQLMNFQVISNNNTLNPNPILPELLVVGPDGKVLGYNVHEFESPDSSLYDITLPTTGTYYVGVDSLLGLTAGNYQLFMYSFATSTDPSTGDTLVGGSGQDTLVGSSGNDQIHFPSGSIGSATVQSGSGQDVVNLFGSPNEQVTIIGNATIQAPTTTTTLTSSLGTSAAVYGQSVTFTATVAPTVTDHGTPTGTVSFYDGTTLLGTETLPSSGADQVSLTTSALPVDTDSITAVYSGDSIFETSTSAALSQTVNVDPTTTTLISSANPSVYGQTVTFTATVSANNPGSGTPTGTVTFYDGSTELGTGSLNSNGVASYTTTAFQLAVGVGQSITASYASDGNYASSTSVALSQTVNTDPTTTTLTSSANPSVYGQTVTFTATVSANNPGSGTPTGTVTFYDGSTELGTGSLNSSGVASYTTSAFQLLVGAGQSITASYASDGNYASSTSVALNQTVNTDPTTTVVASSSSTSVYGQTVTFTATVSANNPGSGTPTGTVTFYDGSTELGTGSLNSSGVASYTTSAFQLLVGAGQSITASYASDGNYASSTSVALNQTVNVDPTTTTLTSSANPSVYGQTVTFTATVSANAPGSGTPTGTVTFYDGSTELGTGSLNSSGVASYTTSAFQLLVGANQSITASYASDGNYASSTSVALSQTVNTDPTTTTLTSSANPSVYGQTVTFTATVSANAPGSGTPAGTVTFYDGSTELGTGTLSDGIASYTTSTFQLLVGANQSITASYASDGNYASSTSVALNQTVNTDPTTTVVASSSSTSVYGQTVTFTATVSANNPGSGTPTGTVTFYDGSTELGTGSLNSNGVASYTTTAFQLAVGVGQSITASYASDGNYASSTSVALSQTVNTDPTTTTLTSSANPSVYGQTVTFTATVSANAPGSGTPTGTVTFYDGSTELGTGSLNSSGVASYTTSAFQLLVGANQSITASYASDGNYASSTSAALSQTVNTDPTTTVVASSSSTSVYGQTVTFTATVSANNPGSGTPTGTVTFYDGSTELGTGSLNSSGVASYTTSAFQLLVGAGQSITASYASDGNYASSTSVALNQTVNTDPTTTVVASSSSTSVYGQTVTFTATVSANNPGSGTPTGTVTFYDGSTELGTGSLNSSGVASYTTSAFQLLVGAGQSITASYASDGNYASSTSVALNQTVNVDPTTTTLTSSANPSVYGQTVTFTATVSANAPGSGTPTGTVTFYDGSTELGTGSLNSSGVASYTTSAFQLLVGANQSITASYASDGNYASSTSAALSQTVNVDPTTTALTSSANPSVYGQTVTFTATVSANNPGSGTPTGTVTFYDGSTELGTGSLNSSGVASYTTTAFQLAVGVGQSITASYATDGNYASSTSLVLSQTVDTDPTTTALTSSANSSDYGQTVTFTATVSANSPGSGTPTGTVTFYDGSNSIGSGTLSDSNGTDVASFSTSTLSVGGHSITAVYGGDTNFTSSASSAITQIVNSNVPSGTTITTGTVNGTQDFGQALTFTATVTPQTGTGTPTGTVDFYDTTTQTDLGSVVLLAGSASLTTSALPTGNQAITLSYSGDNTFLPSNNDSNPLTVAPATSIYVLNSSAAGALNISGNASVSVTGVVVVDSKSSSAVEASGNASVDASSILIVGGDKVSGNASFSVPPVTGAASESDPLANLPAPTVSGTPISISLSGNKSQTINAGVYSQIKVSGNASLTMNPGVYVLAGGNFSVTGNASVTGNGVTIYMASSNYPNNSGGATGGLSFSGNIKLNLSAPTTGAYAGILIYQPSYNSRALSLSGNGYAGLNGGIIYAPSALLSVSGNAQIQHSSLVVGQLQLNGNSSSTLTADNADGFNNTAGQLLSTDLLVYVDNSNDYLTSDELASIQSIITTADTLVEPYGVRVTQVTDPTLANVVISAATDSPAGDAADGVLGCFNISTGQITILEGWNWYAGTDVSAIGADQYSFTSTVTHELGHALGLGHSSDSNSVMYASIAPGVVKGGLTTQDLNLPPPDESVDALHAAPPTVTEAAPIKPFAPTAIANVNGNASSASALAGVNPTFLPAASNSQVEGSFDALAAIEAFSISPPAGSSVNGLTTVSVLTTAQVRTSSTAAITSYQPLALNALDSLMARWRGDRDRSLVTDSLLVPEILMVPGRDALPESLRDDLRYFESPAVPLGIPAAPHMVNAVVESLASLRPTEAVPAVTEDSPTPVNAPITGRAAILLGDDKLDSTPERKRWLRPLLWLLPVLQVIGGRQRQSARKEERPSLTKGGK